MNDLENAVQQFQYGTEIEIGNVGHYEACANVVRDVLGGGRIERNIHGAHGGYKVIDSQDREWLVESDGSLHDGDAEIVTPKLKYSDLPMVARIVNALYGSGCRCIDYGSQHVHVGVGDLMTPENIAALVRVFAVQENIILTAAGTHEHRMERYCRKLKERLLDRFARQPFTGMYAWQRLNRAWFEAVGEYDDEDCRQRGEYRRGHYDPSRYQALNLNNLWRDTSGNCRHTVEFRLFNCPDNGKEAMYNILLCLALCAYAKSARGVKCHGIRHEEAWSSKYDMRIFLLRLGFIGAWCAEARAYYTRKCQGDCAFKHTERP